MARLLLLLLVLAAMLSAQTVNIGVLSFRPIEENQKIWHPLEKQLHSLAPELDYNVTSYTQPEIEKMVANNMLDFIIVQPAVYVAMELKYGVSNIASLVRQESIGNDHISSYGGVIVCLSSRKDIRLLQDVSGKTIAAMQEDGFAAVLIQRDVLMNAGIDIAKDANIIYTGQPMARVLEALRDKKADIGFFRTGYIEELIATGKLKKDELFVLNPIVDGAYPHIRSTPLYPEWAVASTIRPSTKTVETVTKALYRVSSDESRDYHEFSSPLSYMSTRQLMQKYNIYPYEKHEKTTVELVRKNAVALIAIITLLLTFAMIGVVAYRNQAKNLKKKNNQIESILKTASDGIHIHDLDGNIIMCSDSFARMLGYTHDEVVKLNVSNWAVEFNLDELKALWKDSHSATQLFDTKHRRKDGTILNVDILINKFETDGNTYIYASSRDTTSKKIVEKALLDSQRVARIGHYTYDIIHDKWTSSAMLDEMFGIDDSYDKNENGWLNIIHPDDRDMMKKYLKDIIVNKSRFDKEYRVVGRSNNQMLWLKGLGDLQFDEQGNVVGMFGVIKDITVQKFYEENLQELVKEETNKRLASEKLLINQSKMVLMGDMLGAIAHHWRQPLNALGIYIQDVQAAYRFGELNDAYIGDFNENSMALIRKMSKTIDDFRKFFKPDDKANEFVVEEMIQQTIDIMMPTMQESLIRINFNKNQEHKVNGFRGAFGQVLLVLISNAYDALVLSRGNVDEPKINITVDAVGSNSVEIAVEDNAGGISEDILERIFEPYFTTKEQGKGTGIGLYMAKEIIERQMEGKLSVDNADGGARFVVELGIAGD